MASRFIFIIVGSLILINGTYAQVEIEIDHGREFQEITGFGGFGPAKVWWSQPPFFNQEWMTSIIDSLGVNIVRTQLYWDFEESNDNDDPDIYNWAGFNFDPGSDNGKQFEYLKSLDEKGVKIIASVWTPPNWMKKYDRPSTIPSQCYNCNCPVSYPYPENRQMCGGYLNYDHYDEFAEYISAYVKLLKDSLGIDLYGLSIQNEMKFANPFESCVYSASEYAETLKAVGRKLEKEGINTLLFGPEHMGSYNGNSDLFEEVLASDPEVRSYLDVYAVHSYLDGVTADYGSAGGWKKMQEEVASYDKPLWMTETSGYPNTWSGAFDLVRSLHLALKFGKIESWVHWYMAGNIIDNNIPNKKYYIFKNYFKSIRPGALMVAGESSDADILVTAYKHENDPSLIAVLINNNPSESKTIQLNTGGDELNGIKNFRTSATENYQYIGEESSSSILLPPESITTLIYEVNSENQSPYFDEIPDTLMLKGAGNIEIPIENVSDGDSELEQQLNFIVSSSNTDVISSAEVLFDEQSGWTLKLNEGTTSGVSIVSILLQDNGQEDENGFSFNAFSREIEVQVFERNIPPQFDLIPDTTLIVDKEYSFTITGIDDGNDISQEISLALIESENYFGRISYFGGDEAIMRFSPKLKGNFEVGIRIFDDGINLFGGSNEDTLRFNVNAIIPEDTVEDDTADSIPEITFVDHKNNFNVNIYPNPATGKIYISTNMDIIRKISLYSLTGEILFTHDNKEAENILEIRLNEELSGYFILSLEINNQIVKRKLLLK